MVGAKQTIVGPFLCSGPVYLDLGLSGSHRSSPFPVVEHQDRPEVGQAGGAAHGMQVRMGRALAFAAWELMRRSTGHRAGGSQGKGRAYVGSECCSLREEPLSPLSFMEVGYCTCACGNAMSNATFG